jgi:hypothetical protein
MIRPNSRAKYLGWSSRSRKIGISRASTTVREDSLIALAVGGAFPPKSVLNAHNEC